MQCKHFAQTTKIRVFSPHFGQTVSHYIQFPHYQAINMSYCHPVEEESYNIQNQDLVKTYQVAYNTKYYQP